MVNAHFQRELVLWKSFCTTWKGDVLDNLIDTLSLVNPDIFPNIRELILLGCKSPIRSCEAEWSFSAFRCVNTYLRSTMVDERLGGLTLMVVHFSQATQLDMAEVVKRFLKAHPRRLFCRSIWLTTDSVCRLTDCLQVSFLAICWMYGILKASVWSLNEALREWTITPVVAKTCIFLVVHMFRYKMLTCHWFP